MNTIPSDDAVTMYAPKELLSELSEVIRVGLQEAKISRDARKNLKQWWDAESSFMDDELTKKKNETT
jgi:hypothetical protein